MGRGKRKNDKKTSVQEKKSKCNVWNQDLTKSLDIRVTFDTKDNQNFVDYYSKLNIVPQNEWESFYSKLKEPLPTTFRVVDGTIHTNYILEIIEKTQKKCPGVVKRIENFPGYVFEVNVSRSELRSTVSLRTFHQFLVHQSEIGTIFRQELVSMVPVLFMPVLKDSIILDMCAAPGSKTAQLLEELQKKGGGLIIANDSCSKRGHMLIHRLRRLNTSSLFVTNHEASVFPTTYKLNVLGNKTKITFSSVLCDVPCSGDGTLRKSPIMWKQFDTHRGLSLHRMQICILRRALELCEVGGTVVYSTCSFNPIENEAVVNSVLELAMGTISLNRSIERLDSIPCKTGLLSWKVYYKNVWYETFEDVPEDIRSKGFILETMFPDYRSDPSDLANCIRFFPHLFNTGGFFVAVFHKLDKLRWKQKEVKGCLNSRTIDFRHTEKHGGFLEKKKKDEKEEEKKVLLLAETDTNHAEAVEKVSTLFTVSNTLNKESNIDSSSKEKFYTQADFLSFEQYFNNDNNFEKKNEFWKSLGVRYGFSNPPKDVWRRLLVRTVSQESPRKVWLTTKQGADIIHAVSHSPLKILSAGCQLFDGKHSQNFRITSSGATILANEEWSTTHNAMHLKSPFVANVTSDLLLFLLKEIQTEDPVNLDAEKCADFKFRHKIESFEVIQGHESLLHIPVDNPCLLILESSMISKKIYIPAWRGKTNIQLLIDSSTRSALSALLCHQLAKPSTDC